MMPTLQELWTDFETYILQPLAHHYNAEDEEEYIEPLRRAIMNKSYHLYGFDITPLHEGNYRVDYNGYVGMALSKTGVVSLVTQFINSQTNWNGPTPKQFLEAWYNLGGE